jgi:hypothetical protein
MQVSLKEGGRRKEKVSFECTDQVKEIKGVRLFFSRKFFGARETSVSLSR